MGIRGHHTNFAQIGLAEERRAPGTRGGISVDGHISPVAYGSWAELHACHSGPASPRYPARQPPPADFLLRPGLSRLPCADGRLVPPMRGGRLGLLPDAQPRTSDRGAGRPKTDCAAGSARRTALHAGRQHPPAMDGPPVAGRFASVVMDETHLIAAARYIELNPVRALLVGSPEDWPWSSAAAHMAGKADELADSSWLRERIAGWVCTWREFLLQPDPNQDQLARKLRRHEATGRPLGDATFIKALASRLGRNLTPAKRGRKPKSSRPDDQVVPKLAGKLVWCPRISP